MERNSKISTILNTRLYLIDSILLWYAWLRRVVKHSYYLMMCILEIVEYMNICVIILDTDIKIWDIFIIHLLVLIELYLLLYLMSMHR